MKEKIIMFILGLLLGAIIATGAIYFYTLANTNGNGGNGNPGMQMGEPPSNQNGQMTPPDMPNGNAPSGN